jgi:hypothetical protein
MTLRQFADRYGATAVIVVALALLITLTPGNAKNKDNTLDASATNNNSGSGLSVGSTDNGGTSTGTGTDALGGGSVDGSSSGLSGDGSVGGDTAGTVRSASGAAVEFGKGTHCRGDGRQMGISRYMPPCALWNGTDNGGNTAQGVTKDKILVVRFVSQSDPATNAILEGAKLADDPAVVKHAYEALFTYSNQHYETYGRQVVFQDYNASGPDDNDEQMRKDAATIATSIKPFLVFGGPKVFGVELAARGIVCICTVTLSSEFYQSNPAAIWGSLPTSTEYGQVLAEFMAKRLNGKKAQFAGDEANPAQRLRTQTRKFGLIYLEGLHGRVDPEGKRAADNLEAEMNKRGVKLTTRIGYTYDPGRNQQDLTAMIARMRNDGITSIIMFVDPLYPILITGEATRQQYYPEWIISGSGLSDTTAAGRLYDQNQWKHAFGISPLWVTWKTVQQSTGYREAHHGDPNMQDGQEGVLINIYNSIPQLIFTGIHMAGPKLSRDSFAQGMFNYPHSGGNPNSPLIYFTRAYPTAIKDYIEIYYDGQRRGPDERALNGTGMIMKMNGGQRYEIGKMPAGDLNAYFNASTNSLQDPKAVDVKDGIADAPHEQDGHRHTTKCLSCK